MLATDEEYDAFVSYAREPDAEFAERIVDDLKRIGRRWRSDALLHICFDRTSLAASASLPNSIETKLAQSRHLVLLASRGAAQSEWVAREIEAWLARKPPERIALALTDGELVSHAGRLAADGSSALPSVLQRALTTEPLWVDLRPFRSASRRWTHRKAYRRALAEIAAPLLGRPTEELTREDQRIQLQQLLLAAVLFVALIASATSAVNFAIGRQRSRTIEAATKLAEHALRESEREPELALALAVASAEQYASASANGALLHVLDKLGRIPRLERHFDAITSIDFDRDGTRVISSSKDCTARIWNASTRASLQVLRPRGGPVVRARIDPTGKYAFTLDDEARTILWDLSTRRSVQGFPEPIGEFDSCPRFERDTEAISYLHTRGSRRAWSIRDGKEIELAKLDAPDVEPGWIDSSDGSWSARVEDDGSASIRDRRARRACARLAPAGEQVTSVAFRPGGGEIVTCSGRATARIWSTATWKATREIVSPEQPIAQAYYSCDGRWLVTEPSTDARIAERDKRSLGFSMKINVERHSQVTFALHVWDANALTRWLDVDIEGVVACRSAIDPASRTLAVPMEDGSIALVPLDPLAAARERGVRVLTSSERSQFGLPEQP